MAEKVVPRGRVWGVGCEFSPGKSLNPTRFLDLFSQPYLEN
ncbi:hypothetical protein RVR34_28105 [Microcystis aeruginosa FBCC-A68]|nr:hypothetical protein [Microcystis aeruginosa]